ncbi:Uncharacterised protein [Bordetella pertussis]|nr:Uncharacterised protein [Bordetella pertussis]
MHIGVQRAELQPGLRHAHRRGRVGDAHAVAGQRQLADGGRIRRFDGGVRRDAALREHRIEPLARAVLAIEQHQGCVGQLRQFQLRETRQRMAAREHRHRAQASQAMAAQALQLGLVGHQSQVQLASHHHVAQGIGIAHLQVQRRIGITATKAHQRLLDHQAAVGMDGTHAQARLARALDGADLAPERLQAQALAPDFLVQQIGFGRAHHALPHALEQPHRDRRLQRRQRGAHRGRRDVEPARGRGHAFGFVYGAERLDLPQRESHGVVPHCATGAAARAAPCAWTAAGRPGWPPGVRAGPGAAPARWRDR